MPVTESAVRARIDRLLASDGRTTLGAGGAIASVVVAAGRVTVTLQITAAEAVAWEPVRRRVEAEIAQMPGVEAALVALTAERAAAEVKAASPATAKPTAPAPARPARFANLAGVKRIIAVASGKGGVGKSTTAVNLAVALKAQGLAVGVMDADIYGPSGPKLFGLKGQPEIISGRTLKPMVGYGCQVMSIGFLVDADKAMIWRGPMVASAITQMLRDVAWGELDILVVDMPPGTGDAQLTLAQAVPLDGAVIVSTPQDLALIDARRGVAMFRDVGVAILGVIENMSYFVCDECGKHHHIFSHGGARNEAVKLGVPFLGEIPLDPLIRERSDAGLPIVVTDPEGDVARRYAAMADAIWRALDTPRV